MNAEAVVIYCPSEIDPGYVTGEFNPDGSYITADSADKAKVFESVEVALDYVCDNKTLFYDASFLQFRYLIGARALDEQEYEAIRQEML